MNPILINSIIHKKISKLPEIEKTALKKQNKSLETKPNCFPHKTLKISILPLFLSSPKTTTYKIKNIFVISK